MATVAIAAAYSALHAPVGYLIFLLFAIVCVAGTLGTAMKWVPRGEIFFILVFLVIAGIPLQRDGFWRAVAASAGGADISVLMTMLDARSIPDPQIVARRILARASMGSATLDRKQHAIVVGAAAIAVIAAWVCADSPPYRSSLLGAGNCRRGDARTHIRRCGPAYDAAPLRDAGWSWLCRPVVCGRTAPPDAHRYDRCVSGTSRALHNKQLCGGPVLHHAIGDRNE